MFGYSIKTPIKYDKDLLNINNIEISSDDIFNYIKNIVNKQYNDNKKFCKDTFQIQNYNKNKDFSIIKLKLKINDQLSSDALLKIHYFLNNIVDSDNISLYNLKFVKMKEIINHINLLLIENILENIIKNSPEKNLTNILLLSYISMIKNNYIKLLKKI